MFNTETIIAYLRKILNKSMLNYKIFYLNPLPRFLNTLQNVIVYENIAYENILARKSLRYIRKNLNLSTSIFN